VRRGDRCPFCAASRAFAVAAIGTAMATACGGTTEPAPSDAGADVADAGHDAGADVVVGFDAAPDATPDAFVPNDGGIALYGAPPAQGGQRAKLHE